WGGSTPERARSLYQGHAISNANKILALELIGTAAVTMLAAVAEGRRGAVAAGLICLILTLFQQLGMRIEHKTVRRMKALQRLGRHARARPAHPNRSPLPRGGPIGLTGRMNGCGRGRERLPENGRDQAAHSAFGPTHRNVRHELLRVGQCRGENLRVLLEEARQGAEHELELPQADR